jgi:hypothetical protein
MFPFSRLHSVRFAGAGRSAAYMQLLGPNWGIRRILPLAIDLPLLEEKRRTVNGEWTLTIRHGETMQRWERNSQAGQWKVGGLEKSTGFF